MVTMVFSIEGTGLFSFEMKGIQETSTYTRSEKYLAKKRVK